MTRKIFRLAIVGFMSGFVIGGCASGQCQSAVGAASQLAQQIATLETMKERTPEQQAALDAKIKLYSAAGAFVMNYVACALVPIAEVESAPSGV